jgi:predicted enzyme related to lactoylglutathione lyase
MTQNPVNWFEIYVKDMARAKSFYQGVLGVGLNKLESPVPELEMWAFPSTKDGAGASGALAKMKDGPAGGNTSTIIYFRCQDCGVEAKRVEAHGGRIVKDKSSIGQFGFMALATDTEGNMIGLHSMK